MSASPPPKAPRSVSSSALVDVTDAYVFYMVWRPALVNLFYTRHVSFFLGGSQEIML